MKTLTNADEIKKIVKEKYTQVATETSSGESGCCGTSCGCSTGTDADVSMAEDYTKLKGYDAGADLGLGCGLPTEFASIREGDVVLDLGSGAGNDAFVARSATGPSGKVIGVDMTEKMIERARKNVERLKYNNVEFRLGDIEQLPVSDDSIDVVVSNCVLNLVPDKKRAFSETFRVVKPGGHFSVSDIVLKGDLPVALRSSAEMYAGCISGAVQKDEYLRIVKETGFTNITVQKERRITIPDEILSVYLSESEMQEYQSGNIGIYSITVYAEKPVSPQVATAGNESKATWWDPGCCN